MSGFLFSLTGNLARDPKYGFTPGGTAYANFTVIRTDRVRRGEEWQDGNTLAVSLTVWAAAVEQMPTLHKGDQVVVEVGSDLHLRRNGDFVGLQATCRSVSLKRCRHSDQHTQPEDSEVVAVTGGRATRTGDVDAAA